MFCLLISLAFATEPAASPTTLVPQETVEPFALPDDPLGAARDAYNAWDNDTARAILEAYLASPDNYKQRTSTRLLLGRVYMELGEYALASAQFYRVRLGEGGDAKTAAWFEILVDLERGRPKTAIKECHEYRERFGSGRRSSECMIVIGDAEADRGHLLSARNAYDAYLEDPEHDDHMRDEELTLRLALSTAERYPERAIPTLIRLALHHTFASTGAGAEAALERLRIRGYEQATLPDDAASRMALAESRRRSGLADDAWTRFQALANASDDDPPVAAWVERNARRFQRSTRHPLATIQANIQRYNRGESTGAIAWEIFTGWQAAGRWDRAAEWGRLGLEQHESKWPWRGRRDDVAHATMLAGEFANAADAWESARLAKHGSVRQARFYESLTALLSGQTDRAMEGFTVLIEEGGSLGVAARYWRIRTAEQAGRTDTMTDRMRLALEDTVGWYSLLINNAKPTGVGWVVRDGTWRGPEAPINPVASAHPAAAGDEAPPPLARDAGAEPREGASPSEEAGSLLKPWSFLEFHGLKPRLPPPADTAPFPTGADPSAHHNPSRALTILRKLGAAHHEVWPDLKDAHHLAQAGLLEESGPIVRAAYAEYQDPRSVRDPDRRAAIAALSIPKSDWLAASIAAGDYHFQAKHLWKQASEVEPQALAKLQFPVAYGRELWPHCQRWDLDPYLMLAIMRQESIYNPEALSRTGAIGLMQIIKGTGAKLSARLGEPFFAPVTLYNPSVNLRYAVHYMSLLNERFNGNFAMAVASYNGGPHHMSRAHRQTLGALEFDAFVEMIPRKEPRDYVKKVIGYYQQYVELYGPHGATVVLPKRLNADSPEVVNF